MDTGSGSTTVQDKLSEITVTFVDSRLDECLVKGDLISASTEKRLRAVEHWSQKRVKRGLFEERFLATSSAAPFLAKRAEEPMKNCSCVFQVPPVHGRQGLRIGSSFFGYFL
jgi:hypothetical protein